MFAFNQAVTSHCTETPSGTIPGRDNFTYQIKQRLFKNEVESCRMGAKSASPEEMLSGAGSWLAPPLKVHTCALLSAHLG